MALSQTLTFHDHIVELRRRILWVVLAIGVSTGLGYALRTRMIGLLQKPLGSPLFYTSPAGSFNFILKLSTMIGMFITLPIIIYQILRFIEPALPSRIKKSFMIKVIGASFGLASAGIAFGYFYMVPMSLKFFAGYSSGVIKPLISANEYLSYVMGNLITFALVFQIPLIVLFINWIRPIKPGKLLKYQRHVIVGAFGLAIILPFTYDPISQFIVAIPIVGLFYMSVILVWIASKRRPKNRPVFSPIAHAKQETSVLMDRPKALKPAQLIPQQTVPVMATANSAQSRRLSIDGFVVPQNSSAFSANISNKPQVKHITQVPAKQKPAVNQRPRLSLDGVSILSTLSPA